jgi:hypothetical protein
MAEPTPEVSGAQNETNAPDKRTWPYVAALASVVVLFEAGAVALATVGANWGNDRMAHAGETLMATTGAIGGAALLGYFLLRGPRN